MNRLPEEHQAMTTNTVQCPECRQWCALLEVHECQKPTYATRQAMTHDPDHHDYEPDTGKVGGPCRICGFDRHHPWHN